MTPKFVEERDEVRTQTIILAHDVRRLITDSVGPNPYYWENLPLAQQLMTQIPDLEAEYDLLLQSLHHITDEEIQWLADICGAGYFRFRLFSEITKFRPHLSRMDA